MKLAYKYVFICFVFCMQFTSAFAISGTINLPIIIGALLFFVGILNVIYERKIERNIFCVEHILIILFLFIVLFSFCINGANAKSAINHTIAYISSFLLFFTGPLLFFFQFSSDFKTIFKFTLKAIFWCVIISCSFSLFEFVSTNFFGFNVTDYIPRHSVEEYDPLILGFFIRSRGFSEESGHYAFMIGILGPLFYYYLFKTDFCDIKKIYKIILLWIVILSIITSFSVSSFIIIPFCIIIALLLNFRKALYTIRKKIIYISIILSSLIFSGFLLNTKLPIFDLLYITITQKFDSFSFDDRKSRSDFFQNTFFSFPFENKLFGAGPSGVKLLGYDDSYTFLSLYQTICFEIGIIGVLLISCLFILTLVKNYISRQSIAPYFFVSIFSGIIHYNSISNYWYPFLWFSIAFCIFCYNKVVDEKN